MSNAGPHGGTEYVIRHSMKDFTEHTRKTAAETVRIPYVFASFHAYRGTSLIKKSAPPRPYGRTIPRVIRWS